MLLDVNVPPPNNGTSLQDMTVVSNGTTTKTQHCSGGYDGCFSGCMRSYNLESDAYTKCCGAHTCLRPVPCTLWQFIVHSHRRASHECGLAMCAACSEGASGRATAKLRKGALVCFSISFLSPVM